MQILNGRFGPYISFNKKNYRIPKTVEQPAELTLADCKKLIEEAREGYYAESYKIYHKADGTEISRELYCRSTYAASGAKYRVGQ